MRRSDSQILTTNDGALPRPDSLLPLAGSANQDPASIAGTRKDQAYEGDRPARLRDAVADVVRRQMDLGITIVNDGEFGKAMRGRIDYGAWVSYVMQRLTGWEVISDGAPAGGPAVAEVIPGDFYERRDRQAFSDLYAEIDREMFAGGRRPMSRAIVSQADIDNLRAAVDQNGAT